MSHAFFVVFWCVAGVGVIRVPPARSLSGVGSAADRRISAMRAGGTRIMVWAVLSGVVA